MLLDEKTVIFIEAVIAALVAVFGALGLKEVIKSIVASLNKTREEKVKADLGNEHTAHDILLSNQVQDRLDARTLRTENANTIAQTTVAMVQLKEANEKIGDMNLVLQRTGDAQKRDAILIADFTNKLGAVSAAFTELGSKYTALETRMNIVNAANTGLAQQLAVLTTANLTLTEAARKSSDVISSLEDKVKMLENRIQQLMDVLKTQDANKLSSGQAVIAQQQGIPSIEGVTTATAPVLVLPPSGAS